MEISTPNYIDTLLELTRHNINNIQNKDTLIINLYITLLSLYNNNFKQEIIQKENDIIEDILRKTNNLKVKIQLKRKLTEIENLKDVIIKLYNNNKNNLTNYLKYEEDIINSVSSLDPKKITRVIDTITKEKMNRENNKQYLEEIRQKLLESIQNNSFHIENKELYLDNTDIKVSIDDFRYLFNYLLNIDNYQNIYKIEQSNNSHLKVIEKIINILKYNDFDTIDEVTIPLILTYLLPKFTPVEEIKTSDFIIENIKISDLYNMANNDKNMNIKDKAKWNNVTIPNEYLYKKIREMVKKGMYYFNNNNFILENVENKISDFKLSIPKEKMLCFLKENLEQS